MNTTSTAVLFAPVWLTWINSLCGLIILAEAINKLEDCRLNVRGLGSPYYTQTILKALAWGLLAFAGGASLVAPLFNFPPVALHDVGYSVGVTVLIVRSRMRTTKFRSVA